MDEWNQLKEEVKALIEERKKVPMSSESQDGLMSSGDFTKLKEIDTGATHDEVNSTLDESSVDSVRTDVVNSALQEIWSSLEGILSEKEKNEKMQELMSILIEFEEAHQLLMSGVHNAGTDGNISLYVFPSKTPSAAEFTFGTSSSSSITMWNSGSQSPLFWTNRAKTTYANSYGTNITWANFTITTNPAEFQYSYNEIKGVQTSISSLKDSLNVYNMDSIKLQLVDQVLLVERYLNLYEQFFNEFLIGYCTSSGCTPSNCSPFSEWKSILLIIKEKLEEIKSSLKSNVQTDEEITNTLSLIEDVRNACTTLINEKNKDSLASPTYSVIMPNRDEITSTYRVEMPFNWAGKEWPHFHDDSAPSLTNDGALIDMNPYIESKWQSIGFISATHTIKGDGNLTFVSGLVLSIKDIIKLRDSELDYYKSILELLGEKEIMHDLCLFVRWVLLFAEYMEWKMKDAKLNTSRPGDYANIQSVKELMTKHRDNMIAAGWGTEYSSNDFTGTYYTFCAAYDKGDPRRDCYHCKNGGQKYFLGTYSVCN